MSLGKWYYHNNMVTVFTPTYNRAYILKNLYESLVAQTNQDFEWLIVDDGSVDDTESLIRTFIECQNSLHNAFKINYLRKTNGGKHTAINLGLKEAKGELFFIVDSDDLLVNNAIATIICDWNHVMKDNLCGISYLRGYKNGCVIGDEYPMDFMIANYIDVRFNSAVNGDKAEVWVTDIMRQFPYPEFENEHFFSESWSFVQMSQKHDMLWVNKIIYITEYLDDGLSQSGRSLRIRCPLGGMTSSLLGMSPRFCIRQRIKMSLLYEAYGLFAHKNLAEIFSVPYKVLIALTFPLGFLLYLFWKANYIKK